MKLLPSFGRARTLAVGLVLVSSACSADLEDDFLQFFEMRNEILTCGLAPQEYPRRKPKMKKPTCQVYMKCPACEAMGVVELAEPDFGQFAGRLKKVGRLTKYKCPLCNGKRIWQAYVDADKLRMAPAHAFEKYEIRHREKDDVLVGSAFIPRHIYDNMSKEEVKQAEKDFGSPCKSCNWTGVVPCKKCKGRGVVECKEKRCESGWWVQSGYIHPGTLQAGRMRMDHARNGGQKDITVTRCAKCGGVVQVLCPECFGKCGLPCKKCNGLGISQKRK